MEPTDLELLASWRDGDTKAGNALFDRYFDALFRFFRNKVQEGAEDLVQQTFLALVQSRDRFRGDSSFRTYLFTAARSKLYNYLERRGGTCQRL
jgi:RNA polymerase sigma factor (sigma-70 family)